MSVEIRLVSGKRDLKKYVTFPFSLYRDNDNWVPNLVSDDLQVLDPAKNPAFEVCDAHSWLAYKDGKLAGRITAIENRPFVEKWGEKTGRFGWVDFIDDYEVSRALFDTAESWLKERGLEGVVGPMGFTDLDEEGMLVEGFDELGTLPMIYNHPYYKEHLEKLGYKKDVDWIEFEVKVPDEIPEKALRVQELVLKRQNLKLLDAKKSKDFLPYIPGIFDVLEKAYAVLYGAVPLTDAQIKAYKEQYFSFIQPDFTKAILNEKDQVVAVGISMPSLSRALQKAKGRLFPFGWIHLLKALNKPTGIDLYLVGILPEYQKLGITSILMTEITRACIRRGVKTAETSGELEDNTKVQSFWRYYDARQHKRRRVFRKGL